MINFSSICNHPINISIEFAIASLSWLQTICTTRSALTLINEFHHFKQRLQANAKPFPGNLNFSRIRSVNYLVKSLHFHSNINSPRLQRKSHFHCLELRQVFLSFEMNFIRLAMASYGKSSVENQYLILLEAPTCWLLNLHKRLKRLIISIQSDGSTAKSSIRVTLFTCIREGSARRDDKTISKSEVVGWKFHNRSQRAIKLTITPIRLGCDGVQGESMIRKTFKSPSFKLFQFCFHYNLTTCWSDMEKYIT